MTLRPTSGKNFKNIFVYKQDLPEYVTPINEEWKTPMIKDLLEVLAHKGDIPGFHTEEIKDILAHVACKQNSYRTAHTVSYTNTFYTFNSMLINDYYYNLISKQTQRTSMILSQIPKNRVSDACQKLEKQGTPPKHHDAYKINECI